MNIEQFPSENLFLLEFLVDSINLKSKCDCDTPPGDTCVSFQFLDNEALNVCEQDFLPDKKQAGDNDTKSGKSCLFSLDPQQINEACKNFDVTVTVFKKMQPGWLPEKITLGSALISITNLFEELIKCVQIQESPAPAAKTLKDTFKLLDVKNGVVGTISIYVRMSCFGKLIVTQFQMNLEEKSVLFKDMGGQSLYRYKKADKPEVNEQSVDYNTQCPAIPCFPNDYQQQITGNPNVFYPPQSQNFENNYNFMQDPCAGQNLPCNECNNMFYEQQRQQPLQMQPPCIHPDRFNAQMLLPCEECGTLLMPKNGYPSVPCTPEPCPTSPPALQDPPGNYQEIGASMGGNALTIRVHKDRNKVEQINGTGSNNGSCVCGPDNAQAEPISKNIEPYAVCTPRYGGSFDIQPGVQQGNLPFTVKMSSQGQPSGNNVIINPPIAIKPDGTQYTELSDPNKEKFILRIGKKSEGAQKKANLELELCTPRGPDLKPIPKKETRDSQYDPADCKQGEKKGKGKDGKKGKKGKGKKGKKNK